MSGGVKQKGALSEALAASRNLFVAVGFFSLFVNLLMLTGPLYMLQIYDRVLASRSVPTLVALTVLICVLFLALGLLEWIRSRLLGRIGQRLDRHLNAKTFDALMRSGLRRPGDRNDQPLRDLASLRQFLTSPGPLAVFDAPWTPVFLAVVFMMHWTLGLIALAGALLLLGIAVANEVRTRYLHREASEASILSNRLASAGLRNVEVVEAMGMAPELSRRWSAAYDQAARAQARAADRASTFTASTKTLRLFLQSAILGAGALLAINQIITPGMMIAASIIMGRALAPIDQVVGQWRSFVSARTARARLKGLLADNPPPAAQMSLPKAGGSVQVENLCAGPPGARKPVIKDISFALKRGETLGIIGPSAAGKSTLARALVGVWPATSGTVRLDGVDIATWDREELGPQIGYLPQDVELFAGAVSANIARFHEDADPTAIVDAARAAGVHDMILRLPAGYNTEIGEGGSHLSAGQRQRIALARALYGEPVLVVLDEPNSNLDAAGDEALSQAILTMKQQGRTVIVIAHRPSAIAAVEKLLMLDGGEARIFGPKEEVLARVTQQVQEARGNLAALQPG